MGMAWCINRWWTSQALPQSRLTSITMVSKNCWAGCREPASGSDLPMKAYLLSSDCQVLAAKEGDVVERLQNLSPPFDLGPDFPRRHWQLCPVV